MYNNVYAYIYISTLSRPRKKITKYPLENFEVIAVQNENVKTPISVLFESDYHIFWQIQDVHCVTITTRCGFEVVVWRLPLFWSFFHHDLWIINLILNWDHHFISQLSLFAPPPNELLLYKYGLPIRYLGNEFSK